MKNNIAPDLILDAALNVVAENTIAKTSINAIAARCHTSKANVLYYFKTKDELLLALYEKIQNVYFQYRDMQAADDLKSQLNVFFTQKRILIEERPIYDRVQLDYWNYGRIDKSLCEVVMEPYYLWRHDIKKVIDRYLPEVDNRRKEHAAALMISIMVGCSVQCLETASEIDLKNYFNESLSIVLKYLGVKDDSETI